MPPIDRKPERPKPVEVSGDLARRGESHGATTIRDLLELARAQEAMLFAYRIGRPPAEKTLSTIARLKHLTQVR